jgi:acyl carrier protein
LWGNLVTGLLAGLAVTNSQPTPGRVARLYPQAARLCTIITAIPRAIGRRGIELPLPVRYTGNRILRRIGRAQRACDGACDTAPAGHGALYLGRFLGRFLALSQKALAIRGLPMASTFDTVVNIITETCDIPRETITPESHAINDLGIDSLDFLDIAFAIDKTFGIKMPLEQWTQEVNEGKATTDQYFVLQNLCTRIDELVAAKGA